MLPQPAMFFSAILAVDRFVSGHTLGNDSRDSQYLQTCLASDPLVALRLTLARKVSTENLVGMFNLETDVSNGVSFDS